MPSFVDPSRIVYDFDGDRPRILVDVAAADSWGQEGWGLLLRLTMVVVDGPDGEGYLLGRAVEMPEGVHDPAPWGWERAVVDADGVMVSLGGIEQWVPLLHA